MLNELTDRFLDRSLPFFWNSELDLLDRFSEDEITSYANTLINVFNRLNSYVHQPFIKFDTVEDHFDV